MTDTFQTNFKSATNIIKNIRSITDSLQDNSNLSEAQKQLGRVKQYFDQAQEALRVMRTTASSMPYNNKIQAMTHVRNIEQSLATIRKDISRWEQKLNKSSLMGPSDEERKKKLAEGFNQLKQTTDTLKEVNRMAIESEEIGSASLQTLEGQRESLNRSISKVDEVKTNANQSKQLLQDMNKRAICNKVFVSVIILLLIAANLVMIYLIIQKKKK